MTRLRSLIKEVLSQPKKKDCNCGCNTCGDKAPILTEGKFKSLISEGLQHHIDKKISLFESVYRIGSEKHLELIREARALWIRGIIEVSDDDKGLLETHLGHFGLYEGVEVPLDLPMVNEEVDEEGFSDKIIKSVIKPEEVSRLSKVLNSNNIPFKTEKLGKVTMFKFKSYDDVDKVEALISRNRIDIDEDMNDPVLVKARAAKIAAEKEKVKQAALDKKYGSSFMGKLDAEIDLKQELQDLKDEREQLMIDMEQEAEPEGGEIANRYGSRLNDIDAKMVKIKSDLDDLRMYESLDEAKKKKKKKKEKKDPPLNKPKRGGSKAYYVYVRDPKTKKIKKVSFGSGGLRAKIKNKEARNAFAARHNCKNKKDRTKAGYWSCNLPRYAEQLGLGSKMNTFW